MTIRHGFTLLEMLVVLVLIGLASALVAPSLFSPRPTEDAVVSLIDAARRAAIRRAGPVSLSISADGQWQLAADGSTSRSGAVQWPYEEPVRIRINALGACLLESSNAVAAPAFTMDAARCRLQR